MHNKNTKYWKALKAAFPYIVSIFAGSVEFVAVNLLLGAFDPLQAFVMTTMFVVIFMEQWLKDRKHTSAVLGLALSALCLIIFGRMILSFLQWRRFLGC